MAFSSCNAMTERLRKNTHSYANCTHTLTLLPSLLLRIQVSVVYSHQCYCIGSPTKALPDRSATVLT